MKSTSYSKKVLDHFRNPRNAGTLTGKDIAKGTVGNPVCGDLMEFTLKVKNNRIQDIKFRFFSHLVGKSLDDL
ncbi:MAG: iron-sulfur cluster assembly scaffold protein [Candidatus Aminicenantes bacterium]|nr:iron-sulfur cluster assembly scaffold protein [Candidatus Aminicenantes bacterium]